MTEDEMQALEILYQIAKGRYNALIELSKVHIPIQASILANLSAQGMIHSPGHGHFAITRQGSIKALDNRKLGRADKQG